MWPAEHLVQLSMPQSMKWPGRGTKGGTAWQERVHATLEGGLYTSLSCAGSGFLEAEVGPVHGNFLTRLLCRIQTEPVRFGRCQRSTIRGSLLSPLDPLLDLCVMVTKETRSALHNPSGSQVLGSSSMGLPG